VNGRDFNAQDWASERRAFFEIEPGEAAAIIEHWRATAEAATGVTGVELAAAFQRHYTAFGTGVPPNFALVLTAGEAIAFKFDPANIQHPRGTSAGQFKGEERRWPRSALRVCEIEEGRLAWGLKIEVEGGKTLPCRAPQLPKNPAAAAVAWALGGQL
jgi:hypothetical protein